MTSIKPIALAAALLTMPGTAGCSTNRPDLGLDRGVTASCPREIAAPGELIALEVLVLPDGRKVVPIGNVVARENTLTRGALVYRDGYRACRSVVIYAEDRDDKLGER